MLIASPFFSVLCRREGSAAHTKTEYKRRKKKRKKKKPVPEKNKINKTSPLGINCVFQVGHDTALLPYRMDRYARWMCVVKKKWVKYTEYFCSLKGERDQSLN